MNILPQELRDRAQSIVSRIEEESRTEQEAKKQKQQNLRLLAIEWFQEKFNSQVSEQVIKGLGIEIKNKPSFGNGILVEQKGEYCGKHSDIDVYARIELVCGCYIEIYPCSNIVGKHWKMRQPVLEKGTNKWKDQYLCDFVHVEDMSLEEAILKAVFEFEQNLQKYDQARDKEQQRRIAEEAERERRRLEDAAFVAKVKATDAEIRQLIEEVTEPYQLQWKEGFTLKVYKWRYCVGAADGDFDYEEVFSLSPHQEYDEELKKSFVVSVEGDRVALESEVHKPVIHEIVCDSVDSARAKLGSTGFYLQYSGIPPITFIGVNKGEFLKNLQYGYDSRRYWIWEEANAYVCNQSSQMKPWLRKMLGLPEVPSEILIKP
jgi:hypothetical protein